LSGRTVVAPDRIHILSSQL